MEGPQQPNQPQRPRSPLGPRRPGDDDTGEWHNPDSLSSDFKRSGDNWFAVFNPRVQRQLDVELVHNLAHKSAVSCVRFSPDGHYVATGSNHLTQIFDINTGKQVYKLLDSEAASEGDLSIRSVCFSPNGHFLATGAEDKIIRVSLTLHCVLCAYIFSDPDRYRSGTSPRKKSAINFLAMRETSTR